MFKSKGKLYYDPKRNNSKKIDSDWLLLICDEEITAYYRWFILKEFNLSLCVPSWGTHISVIPGIPIPKDKMYLWRKYNNQVIDFYYNGNIRSCLDKKNKGQFFFIDAFSEFLSDLRREIGIDTDSNYTLKYHITIGRTYSDDKLVYLD